MSAYLQPYDIARLCTDEPLLPGHKSYAVKCPAHPDKSASMMVSAGQRATVMFCHAGCSLDDILIELEINMEQLYHDYNKGTPNQADSGARLAGMMKKRRAHTILELNPHESLHDVLYAVMDISAEVWAEVYLRWEHELVRPFQEVFDQRNTLDAILLDLLVAHRELGWHWTPAKRAVLLVKLQNEWAKGRDHAE